MRHSVAYYVGYYVGAPLCIGGLVALIVASARRLRRNDHVTPGRRGSYLALAVGVALVWIVVALVAKAARTAAHDESPGAHRTCASLQTFVDRANAGDREGALAAAHAVAGAAVASGDPYLSDAGHLIERAEQSGDDSTINDLLERVNDRCAELGEKLHGTT